MRRHPQRSKRPGLKESSGSVDQALDILELVKQEISVLSGEDSLVLPLMACGARGVISAAANIIPEIFVRLTTAANAADWQTARSAQFAALPMVRAMFMETNPIPVKTALAMRGVIKSSAVRLPLVPAQTATLEKIRSLLGTSV